MMLVNEPKTVLSANASILIIDDAREYTKYRVVRKYINFNKMMLVDLKNEAHS